MSVKMYWHLHYSSSAAKTRYFIWRRTSDIVWALDVKILQELLVGRDHEDQPNDLVHMRALLGLIFSQVPEQLEGVD